MYCPYTTFWFQTELWEFEMSDLGWETVLASQQLKDLEATPLDDPRPRHFVISSSRTASHPTQLRDQENLALTIHNPDQINQNECRLSRLREMQFWHVPCQQFCFLFVWRFLNQQVSIQKYVCCLTICKWYSRIYFTEPCLSDSNYKTLPSPFQNKSVAPPYVWRSNNWCEDTFLVPTLMTSLMTHEILIPL